MADLYYFNPGCELEVVFGSPSYTLQKNPQILEHDLGTVPMCFAQSGDIIATNTQDKDFKQFWNNMLGCVFADIQSPEVRKKQFDRFVPWGISPRILHIKKGLHFSDNYLQGHTAEWKAEHRILFSRETSAQFFRALTVRYNHSPHLPGLDELPLIARDIDEATEFFNQAQQSKFHGSVFKAPFGSSGRGIRIFRNNLITENITTWTNFVLRTQGSLACEYLFDKVSDFSMHYQIENGEATFVGVSTFNTASNGAYESSLVKRLFEIPGFPMMKAAELAEMHKTILDESIYTKIYSGPLGIDCMVYRDADNPEKLKINPCIEINCRHSMGRLAMEISRIVDDSKTAEYHVFQKSRPIPGIDAGAVFENGKLISGFLPLTPKDTQMFSAGIIVRE